MDKKGNYIGKQIGDYKIIDKKRVNNRMKYYIQCNKCGTKKWLFNIKNFEHGDFCLGRHRKTGSKKIGTMYGDYIVIKKNIKNNRSSYLIKCTKCNTIKEVYNLKTQYHNESCKNFTKYILGETYGDFIITNAYREERIYVDVECLKCGSKRKHIAYKDFKNTFKNSHGAICTIKNLDKFPNKKLVNKLLRTFQGMKTRVRTNPAYNDVKVLFKDSVDFVTYTYDMFDKRFREENIPLEELSIDRINPFGNYEKNNVRCLTIKEQQYNKRIHYKENVEAIENSLGEE